MAENKYIFIGGVMKRNPNYHDPQEVQAPPTVARPDQALTIVSSTNDILQATQAQQDNMGQPMQLSESTCASMDIMQDNSFTNQFQAGNLDGSKLLDELSKVFAKYEIPIGLVNKLLALQMFNMNFIIDDSYSMTQETDVTFNEATEHLKARNTKRAAYMSRWQEAEDRLHIMIDMLAYIPTGTITINFFKPASATCVKPYRQDTSRFCGKCSSANFKCV